uniref:BZIP domain-containing protein n=1 Tax=Davidia involucrata TaxID=16924 RepID=A0A5B7BPF5_DAVIN
MNGNMDNGEVELSDHVLLANPNSSSNIQASTSIDSLLDEFLKNTKTCTHTHTCNPPGPDAAHTHTCYHTHTQVFPSEEDDEPHDRERSVSKPRRTSGNREAVRKYREKKKAHTAYLEEEVKKLQVLNQQLIKKLQGQAILEAEVLRLRGLLLDLRGKIDNELGIFPFQKQCGSTTSFKEGDCGVLPNGGAVGLRCENGTPCFHPHLGASLQAGSVGGNGKTVVSWEGNCQPAIIDCRANANGMVTAEECALDAMETLVSSTSQAD